MDVMTPSSGHIYERIVLFKKIRVLSHFINLKILSFSTDKQSGFPHSTVTSSHNNSFCAVTLTSKELQGIVIGNNCHPALQSSGERILFETSVPSLCS